MADPAAVVVERARGIIERSMVAFMRGLADQLEIRSLTPDGHRRAAEVLQDVSRELRDTADAAEAGDLEG